MVPIRRQPKLTAWERVLRSWSVVRIRRVRRQRDELQREIWLLEDEVSDLERDANKLKQEAEQQAKVIAARDSEVSRLSRRVTELEAENEVLQKYVETQDWVITREQERVKAETKRFVTLQSVLSTDPPAALEARDNVDGM